MQSGYKTITPVQLANALATLESGAITHHSLRVYLACAAMVAIREAAARQRAKIRKPAQPLTRYQISELRRLTGLPEATLRRCLRALAATGLLSFAENEIQFSKTPLAGSEEMLEALSGGRSSNRPIPVPRSLLRFLARNRKPALTKTALAYIARGLSLSRTGEIFGKGTAKVSWIASTFNLSERAVKYARSELIKLGWIDRDRRSLQRKLNRDGAYFVINLDWNFTAPIKPNVQRDKSERFFAPRSLENPVVFAPPYKDRKTSLESKHQKTQGAEALRSGVNVREGEGIAAHEAPPALSRIVLEDFHRLSRLEALFFQAVQRGWVKPCEASALNFIAAAVRAREVGRDPARVFVAIVRRGLWHHITQTQEDYARTAFTRYRSEDPDRFSMPSSTHSSIRFAA